MSLILVRDTIHNNYSEPYYYDSAYLFPDDSNKINKAIPIDTYGKCHIAALVAAKSDKDDDDEHQDEQQDKNKKPEPQMLKVLSAEFYFHKTITVHLELYLFYCFIHFLLYIGQY